MTSRMLQYLKTNKYRRKLIEDINHNISLDAKNPLYNSTRFYDKSPEETRNRKVIPQYNREYI